MRREPLKIKSEPWSLASDPATLPPLHVAGMPSDRVSFYYTVMDARYEPGTHEEPSHHGWFRLRYPILDDDSLTPAVRAACAADFGSGFSCPLPFDQYLFPNVDLTMALYRNPVDDYIGLNSHTWVGPDGIALTQSTIHDTIGPVGTALQTLRVRRRPSNN